MDEWILKIGCAIVFFGLHAIFSHNSDLDETYECDRRWDRAYGNFEFTAFAWILFLGIAGLALYCVWSALPASQPVAQTATAPVICTKRPAAKSTVAASAGKAHSARRAHGAHAANKTNGSATHGNATHGNATRGNATRGNATHH